MSNAVVCMFCRKGPMDGVTVHRINETGVDGIWACNTHIKQTDVVGDPEVQALTDILDGTTK